MKLIDLTFILLRTYSLTTTKVVKLFENKYTNSLRSIFVAFQEKDEVAYRELTFVDQTVTKKDTIFTFVELEGSDKYESRSFTKLLLSDYDKSWLVLDRNIIKNNIQDIRSLIYSDRVKRKTYLDVGR